MNNELTGRKRKPQNSLSRPLSSEDKTRIFLIVVGLVAGYVFGMIKEGLAGHPILHY